MKQPTKPENDAIEKFLDKRLITKDSTRRTYRTCIETYFNIIGKDENNYFQKKKKPDDYETDLNKTYLYYLNKKKKGYMAIRTYFSPVRLFMITNDKTLKELEFWDILKARTQGAEPQSEETILNAAKIKEILTHGDTCAKAMFLMLASSGRRIGELLALTTDDIDISTTPATIKVTKGLVGKEITTTKTKQTTTCFISEEAKNAYKAWLIEREAYLQRACKISKYDKDPDDPRVFPMSYDNAKTKWETCLTRSGVGLKRDTKTGRLLAHPHALRKFFRSYLGDADLAEYLMGHSTLLTRAYRQMTLEDLGAKYLQYMPNVTIFETTPQNIRELQADAAEKDKQLQKMEQRLKDVEALAEMLQMKLDIEKLKNGKK